MPIRVMAVRVMTVRWMVVVERPTQEHERVDIGEPAPVGDGRRLGEDGTRPGAAEPGGAGGGDGPAQIVGVEDIVVVELGDHRRRCVARPSLETHGSEGRAARRGDRHSGP